MKNQKDIINIEEKISTPNKFHSSELFYIEEAKLPFSSGYYTRHGCVMHWHHSWEILCQLEGETLVRFDNEQIISKPGDIIVISGEEPHEVEKTTEHQKILLLQFQMEPILPYFSVAKEYQHISSILLDPFSKVSHFSLRSDEVEMLMQKIQAEYSEKSLGYEIRIPAYIMEMLVYFLREEYIYTQRPTAEAMVVLGIVKPVIEYVEEHYQSHIALNEAAEMACLSVHTFCRTFKKATGYTFVEYVNHIRLKHAEKLLLSTKKMISEIAYDTGFTNLSYFNRKFKESYTMGPSKYRKISGIEELNCNGFNHTLNNSNSI